jgi:hypothetical protein
MGTISNCLHLKVNVKKKIVYILTLLPKGVLMEDFFHLPESCEYLREFSKKFETVLMGYSGAGGKLIHEKNLTSKISWNCPLKGQSRCMFYIFIRFD